MIRSLEICLLPGSMLDVSEGAYAKSGPRGLGEPGLEIAIRVYNEAQIPVGSLTRALHEASRIYSEAGIDTLWLECPSENRLLTTNPVCDQPSGPLFLELI